jgi:phosphoglucosamine mutase
LDCADGAASQVAPEVFRQLGAEVVAINCAVERKSINHRCGSEYTREHPQDFVGVVRQYGAAYGFSFDGDGDRLTVVDANGQVYDGSDLLFVLAMYYYSQELLRGNMVITTHLANRGLGEALGRVAVQLMYTSSGDKNLEAAMWGGDYMLGGEIGGNIIINDGYHTAADAVYAAVVLGGVLVRSRGVGLRDLAAPLQKHPQMIVSFRLPGQLTPDQMTLLHERIEGECASLGDDRRILFWKSSTESGVFRVMVEGGRACTLEEVLQAANGIRELVR